MIPKDDTRQYLLFLLLYNTRGRGQAGDYSLLLHQCMQFMSREILRNCKINDSATGV